MRIQFLAPVEAHENANWPNRSMFNLVASIRRWAVKQREKTGKYYIYKIQCTVTTVIQCHN